MGLREAYQENLNRYKQNIEALDMMLTEACLQEWDLSIGHEGGLLDDEEYRGMRANIVQLIEALDTARTLYAHEVAGLTDVIEHL